MPILEDLTKSPSLSQHIMPLQPNLLSLPNVAPSSHWTVSTDSRQWPKNLTADGKPQPWFFVGLLGEQHDGGVYAQQAIDHGAGFAVIAEITRQKLALNHPNIIGVANPSDTLAEIANQVRQRFSNIPVLAISGSVGKTTVKQICQTIFEEAWGADAILCAPQSFNNAIGVPLTLLQWRTNHHLVILEMGMNHPGELRHLAAIAEPSHVLLTAAKRSHLGGLGSLTAIVAEKGSLFAWQAEQHQQKPMHSFMPINEPYSEEWRALAANNTCHGFAITDEVATQSSQTAWASTCWASLPNTQATTPAIIDIDYQSAAPHNGSSRFSAHFALLGNHNVGNIAAACAVSLHFGISAVAIQKALQQLTPVKGRLQPLDNKFGTLIYDGYNANPDSFAAAIAVLVSHKTPRTLIAGDMAELGEQSLALHAWVGTVAKQAGIERLITVGEQSRALHRAFIDANKATALHFASVDDLLAALPSLQFRHTESVLLKASRVMKFEKILPLLQTISPSH